MTTRLPAKTDTVMVSRNVHLEQIAEMVGLNIDLLRSLNPMYRRDIVPGATEPSPIRLPITEVSRFIDLEDSIYNYKADELLNKRVEVEVNDDVPTYYHKSKRYVRGKRARVGRSRTAVRSKRSTASRKRTTATRKRTSASRKRSTAKRKTSSKRRRR
jgi:membrane-bound lytic murein transglycosylase D